MFVWVRRTNRYYSTTWIVPEMLLLVVKQKVQFSSHLKVHGKYFGDSGIHCLILLAILMD